jgi:hypothetical protein
LISIKHIGVIGAGLYFLASIAVADIDDVFDRIDEQLAIGFPEQQFYLRASGTFDLEGYELSQPSDDTIFTENKTLIVPRLSVALDAQLGKHLYLFTQTRVDRGFDPANAPLEARLDEYAIRISSGEKPSFALQLGKFGTVFGSWVRRHASWENPFVTPPFAYGRLIGIWENRAATSSEMLLRWSHIPPYYAVGTENADKYYRLPLIWGPAYSTGAAAYLETERTELAVEVKNVALSAQPDSWSPGSERWGHPTLSSRFGWQPNEMWSLGFSASTGAYLQPSATSSLAPGIGRNEYREYIVGQDLSFAWHHWQVWAEIVEARYIIPLVTHVDVLSWYLETKYKFTPRFFAAFRLDQQQYSHISDDNGPSVRWGRNTWAIDVAPTLRLAAHLQLKLQYSLQHEDDSPHPWGHVLVLQSTLRF